MKSDLDNIIFECNVFIIFHILLDDGLVIPSIMPDLRHQLLLVAERLGLTEERQAELMGRAATEMEIGRAHV
jgi:hypothetical protein